MSIDTGWVVALAIGISSAVGAVGLLVSERNRANRERRTLDRKLTKLKARSKEHRRRTDARLREIEVVLNRGRTTPP